MPQHDPCSSPIGARKGVTKFDFQTQSHDEALEWVKRVCGTRFEAVCNESPFYFRHRRQDHGLWTVDRVELESGGFRTEPYDVVSVGRLTSGSAHITAGREEFDFRLGDIFVVSNATDAFSSLWSRADCSLVRIPVTMLQRVAQGTENTSERATLRFLSRRPATAAAARSLVQVVKFAERHLAEASATAANLAVDPVGHLLAASILATFPNSLVEESTVVRLHRDIPTTVALAVDFIERNADLPLRLPDIARFMSV